jgi:hypothetical protein
MSVKCPVFEMCLSAGMPHAGASKTVASFGCRVDHCKLPSCRIGGSGDGKLTILTDLSKYSVRYLRRE